MNAKWFTIWFWLSPGSVDLHSGSVIRNSGSLKFTKSTWTPYTQTQSWSERGRACAVCQSFRPTWDVKVTLTTFSCRQKKNLHPVPAESHAAARSLKLLAKIPKDAEATVVLVGKLRSAFCCFQVQRRCWVIVLEFPVMPHFMICDVFTVGPLRFFIFQMCF